MKLEISKKGVIVMTEKTWYRVPVKLLRDNRLTASDIGVFAVIADRADGDKCELSTAKIAEELQICKLTVKRATQKLEACGYIATERKPGKASVYRQLILEPKRRSSGKRKEDDTKYDDVSKYDFVFEQSLKEIGGSK